MIVQSNRWGRHYADGLTSLECLQQIDFWVLILPKDVDIPIFMQIVKNGIY